MHFFQQASLSLSRSLQTLCTNLILRSAYALITIGNEWLHSRYNPCLIGTSKWWKCTQERYTPRSLNRCGAESRQESIYDNAGGIRLVVNSSAVQHRWYVNKGCSSIKSGWSCFCYRGNSAELRASNVLLSNCISEKVILNKIIPCRMLHFVKI